MTVQNERSKSETADGARLGPSAYLVLGFIAELGPCTPYDLKRAAAKSIAYFWTFPHSQLYVEPERLAKLGLLKLYFADLTTPERVRQMAEEQIALHQERLAEYDAFSAQMARYEKLHLHQVPIRMGYLFEEAFITFWTSVLEDPPTLDSRIPSLTDAPAPKRAKR